MRPGEIISVDVLNPSAETVGGGKYLLLLIDQFTSFLEEYVQKLPHPTTGRVSIPQFVNVCANAFDVKIGTLRADLDPEFAGNHLRDFCKEVYVACF